MQLGTLAASSQKPIEGLKASPGPQPLMIDKTKGDNDHFKNKIPFS